MRINYVNYVMETKMLAYFVNIKSKVILMLGNCYAKMDSSTRKITQILVSSINDNDSEMFEQFVFDAEEDTWCSNPQFFGNYERKSES